MKSKKHKGKDSRRRNIRAVMVKRGISGADIARKLGITRQAVAMVISGRISSLRVRAELIQAGVPESYFREEKDAI